MIIILILLGVMHCTINPIDGLIETFNGNLWNHALSNQYEVRMVAPGTMEYTMPTFTVSTRPSKGKPEVKTSLTVNTQDVKPDTIMALAMQALVVKWQGHARKHGIPAAQTINMSDYAPGTRHAAAPVDPKAAYAAMSSDERKAFLAELAKIG